MAHLLESVTRSRGQDNYGTRKTERGERELLYKYSAKEIKLTKHGTKKL